MPIEISGTTGISGVDGSASTPAVQGSDSNTGLSFGTDTVNINTGGTTRATVDSAGRLLLGTTTEGLGGADELTINTGSGHGGITIRNDTSSNGNIWFSDGTSGAAEYAGYVQYAHASDALIFGANASERMRIDSSGRVGIGTTNPDYLFNVVSGNNDMCRFQQTTNNQGDDYACLNFKHAAAQGSNTACIVLFQNSGGTTVGTIKMNAGATAYNTSSDYRLKENVTAISDGITRLKTLKPSRFNFKVDKDTTVDGFLAHEVTAVPEAITGTKDEVDSDNNPIYQGIDQSKLVPLLTAALQEAVAKIEVLETKVAALEAA